MEALCFIQSIEEPLPHELFRRILRDDNLIETSVSSRKGIWSHVLPLRHVKGRIVTIQWHASGPSDKMEESPLIIGLELTNNLPEHDDLQRIGREKDGEVGGSTCWWLSPKSASP
jgi:hypothetical protein